MGRNFVFFLLTLAWLAKVGRAADAPQVVAQWTFDSSTESTNGELASNRTDGGEPHFSDQTPGAYIYDPLSQRSRANRRSLQVQGGEKKSEALSVSLTEKIWPAEGHSFTLECFVQPTADARGNAWIVGKSAQDTKGAEAAIEWHFLANHGVTFHSGFVRSGDGKSERFVAGHYLSSSRLTSENLGWRHVALVYDAKASSVTVWVDYHLSHRVELPGALKWDHGPLLIGGRPDHWGMSGRIDEVRLVQSALGPAQFLRARNDAIEGVSFVSNQTVVPRDAGCYDVKEHFGAAGDGRTDDTAAFSAAFAHLADKVPLAYNTLVVPPGEYLISDMLYCSRFIDVRGAGPEQTILKLKDGAFADPGKPRPVLRMSSTRDDPGSHAGVNGSSISLYLEGITINTGRNNAGAKALEYHANNVGRLENVVLRSGDGAGVVGLDLTHHDVGPALAKHVKIEGFETGIAIRYQEYSHTFEHITLRGQTQVGIRNEGNILAIRKLRSENQTPAIISRGANSMVTLLDAELIGGDAKKAAMETEGGLYCARVKTAGYASALHQRSQDSTGGWTEATVAGNELAEYVVGSPTIGFGERKGALQLPIEETPEPKLPPVSDWVSVATFASHKQDNDWSPAVQAAVDSGARVVYLPKNQSYEFHSRIRLHAPLERLVGFGGEINWSGAVWKAPPRFEQRDASTAPPPLMSYDEPNAKHTLVIDRLGCQHVHHASKGTLVLRSSSPGRYSTSVGGGKLFAEDVGGADWHFDHPQQVWVRQWNPESHAAGPCIHSRGATIWALGFKTEYESQKLLAEAGARTEILGAFIYPIGKIPADRPIFENRNSSISLVYGTSVYHSNHKVHIRDVRGEETRDLGNDVLRWAGSRARMDLYTSDGR